MFDGNLYFWLGDDGPVEVNEDEFTSRQEQWDGDRPQDFDEVSTKPLDVQEGGDHYKNWPIQPIEYCMANNLDPCQSNVVKYVTRFREKGGYDDLLKAKHYIDLLMHFEYGEDNNG